jgi:hypothetical protein
METVEEAWDERWVSSIMSDTRSPNEKLQRQSPKNLNGYPGVGYL